MKKYNFLIVGSGILGLSVARAIKQYKSHTKILIIDKEPDVAYHASGRNSGVLHAGFYYTANSLKARFTVLGNQTMKDYCRAKGLALNECGKLVVAQNEEELAQLYELEKRGKVNGANVRIVEENEARAIEPNIRTYKKALYSPHTASIDPHQVCQTLKSDLMGAGVDFQFRSRYLDHRRETIQTTTGEFETEYFVNCAGLYADQVAYDFDFGKNYTMIPFKGLYLKYTKNKNDVKVNIYPVPNLKNPFLGVHFTKTVNGEIKIGPTATPAFWRENYQNGENFNLAELCSIGFYETKLFLMNSFGFRDLAWEEIKKYNAQYFVNLASKMVQSIDPKGFTEFTQPGIRAQLLNKKTLELVQDFVVEGDQKSLHILNAVSPAFTCAFPFAEFVVQKYLKA